VALDTDDAVSEITEDNNEAALTAMPPEADPRGAMHPVAD